MELQSQLETDESDLEELWLSERIRGFPRERRAIIKFLYIQRNAIIKFQIDNAVQEC